MKPRLAITIGDPAGIGPELILKALTDGGVHQVCRPIVVGSVAVLKRDLALCTSEVSIRQISDPNETPAQADVIDVVDPGSDVSKVQLGQLSAQAGAAAVDYVRAAVALVKTDRTEGIVTAPLNKAAIHLAGHPYPGHTELLAELFGVDDFSLVLTAQDLYVFHVTTHQGLRQACDAITVDRVLQRIRLAHRFARAVGRDDETIMVLGLNPHAGEGGLFGQEELMAITPAIVEARSEGIRVDGPLPADTHYPKALKKGNGFVVAMYHDQGHVPFKSVFLGVGVNVTVGLPAVRTSVDHGTAFDIAGKGIAEVGSLIKAVQLAAKLSAVRGGVLALTHEPEKGNQTHRRPAGSPDAG